MKIDNLYNYPVYPIEFIPCFSMFSPCFDMFEPTVTSLEGHGYVASASHHPARRNDWMISGPMNWKTSIYGGYIFTYYLLIIYILFTYDDDDHMNLVVT